MNRPFFAAAAVAVGLLLLVSPADAQDQAAVRKAAIAAKAAKAAPTSRQATSQGERIRRFQAWKASVKAKGLQAKSIGRQDATAAPGRKAAAVAPGRKAAAQAVAPGRKAAQATAKGARGSKAAGSAPRR